MTYREEIRIQTIAQLERISGMLGSMGEEKDWTEYAIRALEQEPTTKNNLGVDCISREDAIRVASGYCHPSNVAKELAKLPSMGRYDPYTDKFIKE